MIIEKISYGNDSHQYIIFTRPKKENVNYKVIVFVFGGAWCFGNALMYQFVGSFFGKLGYPSVIVSHRLVPQYTFPTQIEDSINAIKTGMNEAKKYGFSQQIILMGYSSGAQIVCLIAYSNYSSQYHFNKKIISGVVSLGGPINFNVCHYKKLVKDIKSYAGCDQNKADPFRYLTINNPIPILCIHGEKDPSVEKENSITFVGKVNELSKDYGQLLIIKNARHINLLKLFIMRNRNILMMEWLNSINKS